MWVDGVLNGARVEYMDGKPFRAEVLRDGWPRGPFKEWFPGTWKLRQEGELSGFATRHGRWVEYDEQGRKVSVQMFDHGRRLSSTYYRYFDGGVEVLSSSRQVGQDAGRGLPADGGPNDGAAN